ncbi:MAG: hypothetical protein CMH47_00805 [Muricauda sp.]|mgnify:CR=1 FL=1|nr:reverse transcriptase family protein [uncultured Allomuricauda sp.]MBC70828.1 hypothetical protein [Allomuricauda sp.]|tara:strand:+ start:6603 stop:7700 length:1098 start_codon:yes stop_codon:yes gene_type:complete
MTFPLDNFITKAKFQRHSDEFIDDAKNYIQKLEKAELPILFSIFHLCLSAKISIKLILALCRSDRIHYYKRFKIAKKRGGYRIILSPNNELKYLQKWILINILEKIPSHKSCQGFDKNKSIKKNAEIHIGSECILKIDLLRFYDSINEKRVYGIFKSLGYHKNLAVSMAKICTVEVKENFLKAFTKNESDLKNKISSQKEGILPQGAPSSPKLSNLILRRLDQRLHCLAKKNGINYSRYADDLTFSGKEEKLKELKKIIYMIIKDENFFINYGKTNFLKRGNRFFVTGLSVHNEKVTVPKKFKSNIEHHLYHCIKNGVIAHTKKNGIENRNFKDWLLGCICFINSVEPELGEDFFEKFNEINWPI